MTETNDRSFRSRDEYTIYPFADKGKGSSYPGWDYRASNLTTFLDALNLSQPIIGCQFELVHSRWPRTIFFAKNITIPELTTNTIEINHAGFTISIPANPKYGSTEISMTIIADKEGFHYYDWRNMVFQTGHPLVAGDPRATIGYPEGSEDTLDVKLRNKEDDETFHHWIIHNFKPTSIGTVEMSHDSSSFVTFDITGTFTHISYDCGRNEQPEQEPSVEPEDPPEDSPEEDEGKDNEGQEEEEYPEDELTDDYYFDDQEPDNTEWPPENSTIDNDNTKVNGPNGDFSVDDSTLVSPDDEAHQETNDKLSEAKQELLNKLQEISEMQPTGNEDEVSYMNYGEIPVEANLETSIPTSDKTGVSTQVKISGSVKYPAQKEAYDAAIKAYNEKVQSIKASDGQAGKQESQAKQDFESKW